MRTTILAFSKYAMPCVLVLATSAHAVPETGGYLGLKAGYSNNDHSCEETATECKRSGGGYGLFGGYSFGPRFSLEMGFTQVADSSAVYPEINLDGEVALVDISAKYSRVLFGESLVFAKLGATYWQAEIKGWGAKVDGSGFSPTLGVGMDFPFAERLSARVEYQYFGKIGDSEVGHTQPSLLSVGLTWHFGAPSLMDGAPPEPLPPTTTSLAPERRQSTPPAVAATPNTSAPDPRPGVPTKDVQAPKNTEERAAATSAEKTSSPAAKPSAIEPIVIDDRSDSPLFARGSTVLKINYALEKIAVDLLRNPQHFVHVVVHTDDQGEAAQNQQLSKARADKIADYLIWQGVNPEHITVEGKGETRPVVNQTSEIARARNRRAEFFISETRRRR